MKMKSGKTDNENKAFQVPSDFAAAVKDIKLAILQARASRASSV